VYGSGTASIEAFLNHFFNRAEETYFKSQNRSR
jgi:hypothetical protein